MDGTTDSFTAMDSVTRKAFDVTMASKTLRFTVRTQAHNIQNAINQLEERNPGMRAIVCKELRPKFLGS